MLKIIRRQVDLEKGLAHLSPLLQRIYSARGLSDKADVALGLDSLLPFHDLKGIDKAVARLDTALQKQERILVVGDFDADGATSTTTCIRALKMFGFEFVDFLVPNRFEYGYGLTPAIVEVALRKNPNLIITVDNGISSIDGVEAANMRGIDVIVTDHHLAGDTLPNAVAIVNPNQPGCSFKSKALAGCGVIFYVMLAFRRHLVDSGYFEKMHRQAPNMASLLDVVALGTVADVVPLDKNNRIIVKQGLSRMRKGLVRPGIKALVKVGKRDVSRLQAADLGFAVAPRLNAAGRLDDMSLGIECLLAEDVNQANLLASELDSLNIERREIEESMKLQALNVLKNLNLRGNIPLALCLYDKTWHQGVIGILAGRLKEKYHRPVIIFAKSTETEIKGSARSIPGLHIRDVLDAVAKRHPELIEKFGGHAMAAGLSIHIDNFSAFQTAFNDEVSRHISESDCELEILSDGELSPNEMTLETAQMLRDAGPWGQAFPEPLFDNVFHIVEQRIVGGKHLKLLLEMPGKTDFIDAIAFNINENEWPNHRADKLRCAYRLDINEFQGRTKLQLIISNLEAVTVSQPVLEAI